MLEFGTKGLGGKLSRHRKLAGNRISCDKLDLIDADRRILVIAKRLLNVPGKILGFRSAQRKGPNQSGEVFQRNLIRKEDA